MKDDFEFPTGTVVVQPDNSRTLEDDAKTSVGRDYLVYCKISYQAIQHAKKEQ